MTQNPKEKTLKNKEREKGLKPKINDKDSINTSFPKFLNILKLLGANIK